MTTELGLVVGEILGCTSAHPVLYEVVLKPVAQDVGERSLQRVAVHPCFRRRSAHGVADKSDGYAELLTQHSAVIIAHGREA